MPPQKEGVTIGFLGTGTMDVDTATDLIEEYIEANISNDDDPVRFVFPLSTDEFSDTMTELVTMAKESDITYEVITSTADKGRRAFTEISESAAKTYHVADVFTQMEQILSDAPQAVLEVLWDDEREEELSDIVGKFMDAGIEVRDLTHGGVRLEDREEPEGPIDADSREVEAPAEAQPPDADEARPDTDVPIYARSDLEKLSRAAVKDIALALGLPPRKSSAAMIEEIMEAQGDAEPLEATETPETTQEVTVAVAVTEPAGALTDDPRAIRELVAALEVFPGRLHDVLDEFLTNAGKTIEGLVFNAKPEQPMAVEEEQPSAPSRRRLVRGR